MLRDEIKKYADWTTTKAEGRTSTYNCAEAMLNSANDYYKLGLGTETLKAIAPFGGGFFLEKTCGFVSGGLAAIGVMYAKDKPYASDKVKEVSKKWVNAFEEKFSTLVCADIKKDKVCQEMALEVADLFEETVGSPA